MNHDYRYDGEVHSLSEDLAYACEKIEEKGIEQLSDLTKKYLRKYAEYLYEFDKEQVLGIVMGHFSPNEYGHTSENIEFIFRPAMPDHLGQPATFAMKFKRVENDNLDVK